MHYDWANARGNGESLDKMEQMGREIERMDQEMSDIQEEIEQLERNRFNLVAVPLTSIKTHKF